MHFRTHRRVISALTIAFVLVGAACGSSGSSEPASTEATSDAVDTAPLATETIASETTATETTAPAADTTAAGAAGAAGAAPGAVAALPTDADVCAAMSAAEFEEITGVPLQEARPSSVDPSNPGCQWIGEPNGMINMAFCCPGMTDQQISASLAGRDLAEIRPRTFAGITQDDSPTARLNAVAGGLYVQAVLTSIGTPDANGFPRVGQPQVDQLVRAVDLVVSKVGSR